MSDVNPPQHQDDQPGSEREMTPRPESAAPFHPGSGLLRGKRAVITGGDSGIGRAVAVLFAREGADVVVGYLDEHDDAEETTRLVEAEGARCITVAGDIGDEAVAQELVRHAVEELGGLDVVVANAAEQHEAQDVTEISVAQLERTFRTNVFGMFHLVKAAMPHLSEGSSIICTSSITAFMGNPTLIDYSSTKGAIVAFVRALSQSLKERGIRVNSVAPGPVWTPLIPATMPEEKVASFGAQTHMGRPAQPEEIATSYVFLASEDGRFFTGQTLHPNGGTPI